MLAVFHVSLTGSDGNAGSAAAPFRTVQQAIDAASASDDGDDIVKVQAGTYDTAQDVGFAVPNDDELDSLDIIGSYDPTFTTSDLLLTPTNYLPQDAGGSISLGDEGTTLANFKFEFDGTNSGVVLTAGEIVLSGLDISNATHGVIGDGIIGAVRVSNSSIVRNSASGLTLTNHHGDVSITSTSIKQNAIGFKVTGATSLTIADLTLQANGESNDAGGQLHGVSQLYYTATSGPTNDFVLVAGATITHTLQYGNPPTISQFTSGSTAITHTRAGSSQQPIITTNDTFHVEIDGGDGDDTISVNGAFLYYSSFSSVITIPGPYGGLHVFGGEGDDLLLSTGVTARKSTSSEPVPHFFYGEGGSDTFGVLTGSGYDDILEVDGYTVLVWHGPDPQAKSPGHHEYRDIETLDLFTAGGNDAIRVTEPATGPFPSLVNISTQDENDGIEINLGRPDINTTFNVDGGDGTNGLTVFTRSANDNQLTVAPGELLVHPRSPANLNAEKMLLFSHIQGLSALAGGGNDAFYASGSFQGTGLSSLSLYGQEDNDVLHYTLLDAGLGTIIRFHGDEGFDDRIDLTAPSIVTTGLLVNGERIELPAFESSLHSTDFIEYDSVSFARVETGDDSDAISISQVRGMGTLPSLIQVFSKGGSDRISVDLDEVPDHVEIHVDLGLGDDELTADISNRSSSLPHGRLLVTGGVSSTEQDTVFVKGDAVEATELTVGTFSSNELVRLKNVSRLLMTGGEGADVFKNNTPTPSILDGLRGSDTLTGGTGRDVIVGEGGRDVLIGDDNEDLLISGPVSFEHHVETLFEILSHWNSADPFADRVDSLLDNYLIPGGTVFDEGADDSLIGGAGADWLLAEVPEDVQREQVELVIDPAQSTLEASGKVQSTNGAISANYFPQLPGSLSATLQGQITLFYSEGALQILPESDVDVVDQPGPFRPHDLQADLAAMIFVPEGYAALRDIHFTGSSELIHFGGSTFPANQVRVSFKSGYLVADVPGLFTGEIDVRQFPGPNNATVGSLVKTGATLVLTLPIDTTTTVPISGGYQATLRLQGTIVASGTVVEMGSLPDQEDFVTPIAN